MNYVLVPAPKGLEGIFPKGIELREDIADDPVKRNQAIIELGAQVRQERPSDPLVQLSEGITSTIRGGLDLAGVDTADITGLSELESRIMQEQSGLNFAGRLAGEVLDPVWFSKFGKLFNGVKSPVLKTAAEVGTGAAISGALQPAYEELGDSRVFNTLTAGGAGLGLGAIIGKIANKYGYRDADEMVEDVDNMPPETQQKIQRDIDAAAEEETRPSLSNVTFPDQGPTEFAQRAAESAKERAARAEAEELQAGWAKATEQLDVERQIKELDDEVKTLPSSKEQKIIRQSVDEANAYIKNKLEPKLANLTKAYNKLSTAKKPMSEKRPQLSKIQDEINATKQELDARVTLRDNTLAPLADRVTRLSKAKKDLAKWRKTGKLPEGIKGVPKPMATETPTPPKAEAPVQATEAPAQPQAPVEAPVISPEAVGQRLGRSAGSRESSLLNQATGAERAVKAVTGSVASQRLPEPTGIGGRPEMTSPEKTRLSVAQQSPEEAVTRSRFNVDDMEGDAKGRLTFKELFEAAEDKEYFIRAEIDAGNYRDYVDWLADEFANSGKILSPAAKMVASRVYAVASESLVKLNKEFRKVSRGGEITPEGVDLLRNMQLEGELRKAMDEMRNIERISEADRKNTSFALRTFKQANIKQQELQEEIRKGYVTQLFLGNKC